MPSAWTTVPLNSPDFAPLGNLVNPKPSSDGSELRLNTGNGTDWWRVPFPAPGRDDTSGGVWGFKRKIGKEGFEVRCELQVDAGSKQQLSPTEWAKTGAEFDHGKMWYGAVVCNPFSDWSIQPKSDLTRFTFSLDPTLTTLRIYLGPGSSSPSSAEDGDIMIREVKSFGLISAGLAHITPGSVPEDTDPAAKLADMEVTVGVMACSPIGKGEGPECVFRRFEMRDGVRSEA